jgi:hypothetical protein
MTMPMFQVKKILPVMLLTVALFAAAIDGSKEHRFLKGKKKGSKASKGSKPSKGSKESKNPIEDTIGYHKTHDILLQTIYEQRSCATVTAVKGHANSVCGKSYANPDWYLMFFSGSSAAGSVCFFSMFTDDLCTMPVAHGTKLPTRWEQFVQDAFSWGSACAQQDAQYPFDPFHSTFTTQDNYPEFKDKGTLIQTFLTEADCAANQFQLAAEFHFHKKGACAPISIANAFVDAKVIIGNKLGLGLYGLLVAVKINCTPTGLSIAYYKDQFCTGGANATTTIMKAGNACTAGKTTNGNLLGFVNYACIM